MRFDRDGHLTLVQWAACLALIVGCDDAAGAGRVEPVTEARSPSSGLPVAVLVEVEGDVRWKSASGAAWTAARTGRGLDPADAVQTMAEGRAVVRFRETGVEVALEPGTTLRVPEQGAELTRLRHLSGRLVARVESSQRASRVEVDLPPGTLVLDAPRGEDASGDGRDRVEARVDVDRDRTEISMVEGEGTLDRVRGGSLRIAHQHFVSVATDGTVLADGLTGAVPTLLSPEDGAALITRGEVAFRWEPIEGVDGYVVEMGRGGAAEVLHRTGSEEPSVSARVEGGGIWWRVRGRVGDQLLPPSEPRTLEVQLDRTAPPIVVSTPAVGARVQGATVEVSGRTEPGAELELDGQRVRVAPDGSFRIEHPVPRGLANLVLRVRDEAGNARVLSRAVLRP